MLELNLPEAIITERLKLQRLRYEDAEEIYYTYASKPEATRFVAWPTHVTIADTRTYLGYAIPGWRQGVDFTFSIREINSNRMIGSCGILNDQGRLQYGYILGPVHWGKGFATEAGLAIMSELQKHSGIYRICAFADVDNVASIRVLQKIGMKEEATLEKWFRFVNQGNQPKDCVLYKL